MLAQVFEGASRSVLATVDLTAVGGVLDLGCGPGHTTALLAETFASRPVTGIDRSPAFVELARADYGDRADFRVGDVTADCPVDEPVALVNARLLLSHLSDVGGLIARWHEWLVPDGIVVLEEPETIHTDDEMFAGYLRLTDALVADRGATMFAGPLIDRALADEPRVALNRALTWPVETGAAAQMFALNVESWRHDEFIRARMTERDLDELHAGLLARVGDEGDTTIRWEIRQVVLRSKFG